MGFIVEQCIKEWAFPLAAAASSFFSEEAKSLPVTEDKFTDFMKRVAQAWLKASKKRQAFQS